MSSLDATNTVLNALDCLGFESERPERWIVPLHIQREWALSESEVWDLYQVLLDTFRTSGAVSVPRGVDPEDELFETGESSSIADQRRPRSPQRKGPGSPQPVRLANKRSDYLTRLAQQIGLWDDPEEVACNLAQRYVGERSKAA